MFSSLMMNTWIAVNIVAVIAGVTGFSAVLRGQSSAAHAIPNGAVSVAVIAVMYRPLLLASALPEAADARGVSTRRMELCFLIVMALATSMTVPVVGALLMFALMIGPAAAARSFTRRPGHEIAVAAGIALVTVWAGIALSFRTNWPLGFDVGVIAAGLFLLGQGWAAVRRRGSAPRPRPALSTVQ